MSVFYGPVHDAYRWFLTNYCAKNSLFKEILPYRISANNSTDFFIGAALFICSVLHMTMIIFTVINLADYGLGINALTLIVIGNSRLDCLLCKN